MTLSTVTLDSSEIHANLDGIARRRGLPREPIQEARKMLFERITKSVKAHRYYHELSGNRLKVFLPPRTAEAIQMEWTRAKLASEERIIGHWARENGADAKEVELDNNIFSAALAHEGNHAVQLHHANGVLDWLEGLEDRHEKDNEAAHVLASNPEASGIAEPGQILSATRVHGHDDELLSTLIDMAAPKLRPENHSRTAYTPGKFARILEALAQKRITRETLACTAKLGHYLSAEDYVSLTQQIAAGLPSTLIPHYLGQGAPATRLLELNAHFAKQGDPSIVPRAIDAVRRGIPLDFASRFYGEYDFKERSPPRKLTAEEISHLHRVHTQQDTSTEILEQLLRHGIAPKNTRFATALQATQRLPDHPLPAVLAALERHGWQLNRAVNELEPTDAAPAEPKPAYIPTFKRTTRPTRRASQPRRVKPTGPAPETPARITTGMIPSNWEGREIELLLDELGYREEKRRKGKHRRFTIATNGGNYVLPLPRGDAHKVYPELIIDSLNNARIHPDTLAEAITRVRQRI